MYPTFAPIPPPPAREPDQTLEQYGAALVLYMMRHDGTTASLTDEQIQTADYAIGSLLARQARPDETIAPQYFARLNDCRRRLTIATKTRADEQPKDDHPAPQAPHQAPTNNGGEHEPRRPLAPAFPPAGGLATPAPTRAPIDF